MHTDMAQQLQRTCGELHEELLERLLRFRGVSAVRYKTKPFEVMIRSP